MSAREIFLESAADRRRSSVMSIDRATTQVQSGSVSYLFEGKELIDHGGLYRRRNNIPILTISVYCVDWSVSKCVNRAQLG